MVGTPTWGNALATARIAAEGCPCWSRATTAATVTVVRYSVVDWPSTREVPTSVTGPVDRPEGTEQVRRIGQGVERQ